MGRPTHQGHLRGSDVQAAGPSCLKAWARPEHAGAPGAPAVYHLPEVRPAQEGVTQVSGTQAGDRQ
eukprot:2360943-Pyramimonas_sp.AAC.1